ncbi:Sec1-like protein [Penicillium capsulatum]|uniref:Sec1-like protein n=1 Tax=Penicillium capsulatum TaxID=69766 RepID=A0A9W9ICP9_9EURO|nr:Sec1-like protein [Penicillium capsulatum]KAJ6135235.1 Sec1-like protein [Penicillium capsulatum]
MAPLGDADYCGDKARRDLLALLEGARGKKNLVISQELAGPVGLFVKFSVLQEYGVDRVFLLENANVDSSQRNVVFLVRGEKARHVRTVAEQIKRLQNNGNVEHEFSIFFAPRRTLVSNTVLEEMGIIGDVNIAELPLYFLPLEQDILSLELEDAFDDLYLHKDPGCIFQSAKALMGIQQRHGYFPRIVGKGDNARRLADLLLRMRKELDAEESSGLADPSARGLLPSANIENLIIIDRDVDFATPLLTQLTYEGLIDEYVGIKNNQAEVDTNIVGPASAPQAQESSKTPQQAKQGLKRKIQLDASDQLFNQLRDANFAIVGDILNKVARRLETEYQTRHTAQTTNELREFVNKLPTYQLEHQSLRIHTNLAEEIMRLTRSETFRKILEVQQNNAAGSDPTYQHESIEELISRDVPLKTVLRLLCLESCMSGGLRPRDLENFKRQVVQAYGHQHLLTFWALEKMDLLQPRSSATAMLLPTTGGQAGSKTNYGYLRKNLRLVIEEVSEQDPNDISYVYSGFAPLSVRLVQCVLQKPYILSLLKGGPMTSVNNASTTSPGWLGFEDVVKSARGSTFSIVQKGDDKAVRARQTLTGNTATKIVYVFFLGGITFTEIAALRFIAAQEAPRRKIIICTTGVVSGDRMMESAMEKGSFAKVE